MRRIVSFIIFINLVIFVCTGYCLNLDKIKTAYLSGDYKTSISDGEKILLTSVNHTGFDELYYYLGLSYLKESNFVRSEDMFGRILSEFKNSKFTNQAKLALGDTYFLQGDFSKAEGYYKELLGSANAGLKPSVLYRLNQLMLKNGNSAKAKEYLEKLKQDYPFSLEAKLNKEVNIALKQPEPETVPADSPSGTVYSVQVGFFSSKENALNLSEELAKKDFPAYLEEEAASDKTSYRVKIGKFKTQQEAEELGKKLSQAGYSTKICP
jgi:tetratricopeptide (TPR) repeat protein